MNRYHINKAGDAGICKAAKGKCPFGSADDHYATPREARAAYEKKQESPTVAQEPRYDLEEMSVLDRMKFVLEDKHGWYEEDFAEMTFADIESEFLDTYGEKDFRPAERG